MSTTIARHDDTGDVVDGSHRAGNVFDQLANVAKDPSIDAGKLKVIYDLMKDYKEEERKEKAEKARVNFYAALADMQGHLPIIKRDTQNPNTRSRFAQLSTIWAQCLPIWTKYGFAVSFDSRTLENSLIEVSLKLSHRNGHTEIFHTPSAPPDTSGLRGVANKTFVQGNQSTITYLQRGLLCRALGIVTANFDDDDDDGAGGAAPATVVQRRGQTIAPIARAEEPIYPPRQTTAPATRSGYLQQAAQDLMEEKRDPAEAERKAKWHAKFRESMEAAETAEEVEAILRRASVKDARENWPLADRKLIEDLIKHTYERLSGIFSHPNGEEDWGESPDSPPWEQDPNESDESRR